MGPFPHIKRRSAGIESCANYVGRKHQLYQLL